MTIVDVLLTVAIEIVLNYKLLCNRIYRSAECDKA